MARHGVGPGTVGRAVSELVREGLVEARPGRGTFVADRAAAPGLGDLGWQTVALGERAVPAAGLEELVAVPRGDLANNHATPARSQAWQNAPAGLSR